MNALALLARVVRVRPCLVTGNDCQEWCAV